MNVFWSSLAIDRVAEVAAHFASEEKAGEWIENVFEAVKRLEVFPESGRAVPEMNRLDIREIFFESYRIIYKVKPERVEVLTLRHMRQQLGGEDMRSE